MAGIIEVKDQGKLRIYDADNSHYIDIVVPSSVTANRTITIPDASFTVPQVTNATHSGEVTGATALTIADNIVDEANLKISNSPTNGYALTAQSGNTGGLTWAAAGLDGWSSSSGNLLPADASKGIYLGVNSATAANLLDDYEEGTFTLATSGISYTQNTGYYRKVGNLVYIMCYVLVDTYSSGSRVGIAGLPFTSTSHHADSRYPISASRISSTHANFLALHPFISNNSTSINMDAMTSAGKTGTHNVEVWTSSTQMTLAGCYIAD